MVGGDSEELNNFLVRVGEVSSLVRGLTSPDRDAQTRAAALADRYLREGGEAAGAGEGAAAAEPRLRVTADRTLVNRAALAAPAGPAAEGTMDPQVFMREVSKDAEKRHHERKIRQEQADTWRRRGRARFGRREFVGALRCYDSALQLVRDSPMLHADRALTCLHLRRYTQVVEECERALRLNEQSFKARLYRAKARQMMGLQPELEAELQQLHARFPQHRHLVTYFLDKELSEDKDATDESSDGEHDDEPILGDARQDDDQHGDSQQIDLQQADDQQEDSQQINVKPVEFQHGDGQLEASERVKPSVVKEQRPAGRRRAALTKR